MRRLKSVSPLWMIIPRLSIVSLRPMIARPSTRGSGWPCGFFRVARDCRRIRRSRTDQPLHLRKRPFRTCTFASRNHAMRSHNHARRSLRLRKMAAHDITARTVYLPSGRRLEAHSGFGDLMDNPRHVHVRMQGATPPNVYNLTLRERLFHGVRAIRLNPVDGSRMCGRGGTLAHPYMLGANGQSNGCVSLSDYPEFLNAFLRGEVTRLVVVERLESPPGRLAAGQLPDRGRDELKEDRGFQYAAASY